MSRPWTDAHRREALRWLCAALADLEGLHMPITIRERDIASEMGFRRAIVREVDIDGQKAALRRVRGLAEGRLVREHEERWKVTNEAGAPIVGERPRKADTLREHQGCLPQATDRLIHVRRSRIRRAR